MSPAKKPINSVLLVVAMQAEAEPIVEELGLKKIEESPYASPDAAQLSGRTPIFYTSQRTHSKCFQDKSMVCSFRGPTTAQSYSGTVGSITVNLVHNGKDRKAGVDKVGTNAATLTTYLAIDAFTPDVVISAGTAGGFASRGATIASIFVSTACVNHDRRIPLPGFAEFGPGKIDTHKCGTLAEDLGVRSPPSHALSLGKTTDNSLQ